MQQRNYEQVHYMRRAKAADYLQKRYGACTSQSLAKLACVGGGPLFQKFGHYPLYLQEDLDTWAMSRLSSPVRNTSELRVRTKLAEGA